MGELSKRFQDILKDIEGNITDEKEREYISNKIVEISMLHVSVINELTNIINNKIDKIQSKQNSMETKLNKIQSSISGIEDDIYDDGYDFEITCPYCNKEFIADVESKTDIKCPECQNIIELDWNGGEEQNQCSGHCSRCNSRCGESFLDEFGTEFGNEYGTEFGKKFSNENSNQKNNEDDEDDDF